MIAKAERPKEIVVSLRTFQELRTAIEGYAKAEHRTTGQMAELLLREAVIARRKRDKKPFDEIERLP